MRVILDASPRSQVEDLLARLRWMSVRWLGVYNKLVLVLVWKIFHEHRTTSAMKWNLLPIELRHIENLNTF